MLGKYILSVLILFGTIIGNVFAENEPIYVVDPQANLCGEFIRWNTEKANWLPDWWRAISLDNKIEKDFASNLACQNGKINNCCKSQWYRYAWTGIWIENISWQRKSAEFLAGKKIINNFSLNPGWYNLESFISRKEVMKVIINTSTISPNESCSEIFFDVENDWGCKYIEAAFEYEYITWNQSFRPDDRLSKTEALKLIFKARNIEKAYSTNSWQEDYISTALYYWYIDEKYSNHNEPATRWWLFQALARSYDEYKKY